MLVKLSTFNKMCNATNNLYISRKGWTTLNSDEKTSLAKTCQRVVYIIFNPSIENEMAECSEEELKAILTIQKEKA